MAERQRRKQTLNDVIYRWKKPYISIIFLTLNYQDKFKDKKNGLRLLHYRYALVKNHKIKSLTGLLGLENMKQFFGYKLRELYTMKEVEKCITTTNNLSKYLNNLVEMGALKKNIYGKDNLPVYRIDKDTLNKIWLVRKQSLTTKMIKEYPDIFEKLFPQMGEFFENELKKRGMDNDALSVKLNFSLFPDISV